MARGTFFVEEDDTRKRVFGTMKFWERCGHDHACEKLLTMQETVSASGFRVGSSMEGESRSFV